MNQKTKKMKLDNPVWDSLCETHQHLLIDFPDVKFYNPKYCSFGAFLDPTKTLGAINEYAKLVDKFFLVSEKDTPVYDKNNIDLIEKIEGCQMVLEDFRPIRITEKIVPLTKEHKEEVFDLIWLVMPGYYRKDGFKMGDYFGIFKNEKLVSIAGMRLQTNDFIEVSGIVTHPDHQRKGLAIQLTCFITQQILSTGKHPILHTTKGNAAIQLYEKLGYQITRDMNWWYFSKK